MTVRAGYWGDEAMLFFIQLSQRKGRSQRKSIAIYRATLGPVSDARFRAAWNAMAAPATMPKGRYSYDVRVVVRDRGKATTR